MDKNIVTRRRALQVIGISTGGVMLAACAEKKEATTTKSVPAKKEAPASMAAAKGDDDCNATIDDTSKKLRSTLQYVEKSTTEGKMCSNCLQYNAPAAGKKCGGCKLFTGPVQPNGYCLSWAAMAAK